jgi:N-formylglutamate amidohydrolase
VKLKENPKYFHNTNSQTISPLPVLFTSPHGGTARITPTRKQSNYPSICINAHVPFRKKADRYTVELVESLALNIFRLYGKESYRKIALVHRSFVDFNRDPECAFEFSNDHLAEHVYNEYHNGIMKIIKKMYNQNNQGLHFLFDFHGTDNEEAEIFIGTDANANGPKGSTICGLLELNPNALWDDTGLIKLLQDRGYSTWPRTMNEPEFSSFDGGTTIKKYGGPNVQRRVESIQCEVGLSLRDTSLENRPRQRKFAKDMAKCIYEFIFPYISQS